MLPLLRVRTSWSFVLCFGLEQLLIVSPVVVFLFLYPLSSCAFAAFYLRKVGFKNSFHIIFFAGIPTVLVMIFGLGQDNPSLGFLVVIFAVCITSTGPIQPFIATLFMGQSLTDEDKGFFSGMFRSTQALGKAFGSGIVASLIAPAWIEEWRKSLDIENHLTGGTHSSYALIPVVGYLIPLVLSYACFLIGESCFLDSDRRGWEKKNAANNADLYINCCSPGGLVIYQTGYEEKKIAKIDERRRKSESMSEAAGN